MTGTKSDRVPTDNWEMRPRYRDIRYTHLLVIDGLLNVPREKVSQRERIKVGSIWNGNALPDELDFVLKRDCPVP